MNKMLITTAGLAEIVNAEQSGTAPVVLSHVAFGTGQYTATADMTALKSEFKRFDAVAGGAISDNMIHLTIHDNSTDKYTVNEVGVFTAGGTLFAVISQTTPIMEKSATSESMLAIDIALTDIDASSISFGDTNLVLNPATTETAGVVELSTDAEATAGTDTTRAMTPACAKAARDADTNIVHRTGNETIAGTKTFTSKMLFTSTSGGICHDNDSTAMAVCGGTGYQNGASVYLYGKDSTANAGSFIINANDGTNKSVLFCKPDGTASWNNKNLVMSVNGKNADAAGNVEITAGIENTATGSNSLALGTSATASGADSTAVGYNTTATDSSTVALGRYANAGYSGATAVGYKAEASGFNSTAVGKGAIVSADGNGSIQIGNGTNKTANTLQVDNHTLLNTMSGKIPAERLPDMSDTYLPTSGGAMTTTTAIYRDVFTSHLSLFGGTNITGTGAQLDLCGMTHSTMPGTFQLHARNMDTDMILRGETDGTLTWNDKYVLTNSYVASSDTGAIMLTAGTTATNGAYFRLYGKDHSSGQGTFNITASDGTKSKALVGKADGTLTWAGERVLTANYAGKESSSIGLFSGGSGLTDWTDGGAWLQLFGRSHESGVLYSGKFMLGASRGSDRECILTGDADGGLTWNDINISAMSMPSGTYKDLTLGASGNSYTAPADGWFLLNKIAGANNQYVQLTVTGQCAMTSGGYQNLAMCAYIPVKKGDVCAVHYYATGETKAFRFIYAKGAEHLAS